MAIVSTSVFYKSLAALGDICGSAHEALTGNGGLVAADPGILDDQYIIWYEDGGSLPPGMTVQQLLVANIPIYVDNNLEYLADPGFFASSVFDGTQTVDTLWGEWKGTQWDSTGICETTIPEEESTVKSISVYFSKIDPGNLNGEYCQVKNRTVLYYDYATSFPTLEALIYHKQHVDPAFTILQAINGCDAPIITDLNDPVQLAALTALENAYYGESIDYFYLHNENDWYHANSSNVDYSDTTIVPNQDPGSTKESAILAGWNPFYCEDANLTEIELYYAANSGEFCDLPNLQTYYYFANNQQLSLAEIVAANIPIFTSLQSAIDNYYCPNLFNDLAPSGAYGNTTSSFYTWDANDIKWTGRGRCFGVGEQIARSLQISIPRCGDLIQSVSICYYPVDVIEVYYKAAIELSLLEIVQNNVYLYNTESAANSSDYNQLINHVVIKPGPLDNSIPSDQYIIWSGSYYLAKDSGGTELQAPDELISQGYECPAIIPTTPYESEILSDGGVNVFYAFKSCGPVSLSQDPNAPSNVYPIYLVDAAHNIAETNYMSDLVDQMLNDNLVLFSTGSGCNCVEYVHTVESSTTLTALQLLETHYANVQVVAPQDLGIVSEGTIVLYSGCLNCQNDEEGVPYTFPFIEQDPIIEVGPNMDIEKNYKLENISKPLLRTNPKLSTNVKIMVDEGDRIYLESIDANQNLANSTYKKWELDKNSKYSYDLARYWNDNNTPLDSVYDTLREYSDTSVLDSYDKQFEEEYHYGAQLNNSKLYAEDFRIFAPIWVDFNLPKKFVIYRVDNPKPSSSIGEGALDKMNRIIQLVKNSTIVKVFDLEASSAIGSYLRNHVQDEIFPTAPLTISMEKDEVSTYNGIDLIKGGFVEKSENIYNDFVKEDKPLIDANDFITDGFRRNKIACANLINLEFLFNDESAQDYSVNRYFGLYVDDIDSGVGEVASVQNGLIKFRSVESYLDGSDPTYAIPDYKLMQSTGVLGYIRLLDSFYNIDSAKVYDAQKYTISVKATDSEISSKLGIFNKDTSVNLKSNQTAGPDYVKLTITGQPQTGDFFKVTPVKKEAVRFKIIKNVNNEQVLLSDDFGNQVQFDTGIDSNTTWNNLNSTWLAIEQHILDNNNPLPPNNGASSISFYQRYDLSLEIVNQIDSVVFTERNSSLVDNALTITTTLSIIASDEIYTNVDPTKGLFSCDSSLGVKRFSANTFSGNGNPSDIAFSIAGAIRTHTEFDAFSVDSSVYIKNWVNGYRLMNSAFLIGLTNSSNFINIETQDVNNELDLSLDILSLFSAYFFNGGHSARKATYVTSDSVNQISVGDFIPTIYNKKYNRVLDIVENIDTLDGLYFKLILQDAADLRDGEYEVFSKNRLRIGLFSAYDVYDMNFDFYDTSNSDLKELELETSSIINYLPYEDSKNSTTSLSPNDIVDSTEWEKEPIDYFSNLLPVLKNEDPGAIIPNKIASEYDRLKENYQKEFAVQSRVVPNINKWVLKDSMTVRDQPYYLNTNEAFGRTNFSPDITKEGRNKEGFTHEWFYIDQLPSYYKNSILGENQITQYADEYNRAFSYINFIDGYEISRLIFTSINYDYFDRFMVTEGHETPVGIDLTTNGIPDINAIYWSKTQLRKKYTLVEDGNELSFAKTILKGLKYTFKTRKRGQQPDINEFVKGSEFNGYRFSVLLKTKTNAGSDTVDYEFIKNDKFKFIILLITLNIDDSFVNYINRKYLYELKHKIVETINTTTGQPEYKYADVNILGALDINSIDPNNPIPYTIRGIQHNNGSFPRFDQQISVGADETYGRIKIDYPAPIGTYYVDVVRVISSDSIQISSLPYYIDTLTQTKVFININYLNNNQEKNATYTYEGGGINVYTLLLSNLSARNFIEKVQLASGDIKYTTIDVNGNETNDLYSVEVDDGTEIIKKSKLDISIDEDRPKSYKLKKETIGYVIEEGPEYYPFLIRHNGKYTVDLRPVVTFTDIYGFNKVIRNQIVYDKNVKLLKESRYRINASNPYEIKKSMAFYKKFNRLGVAFNVGFISDAGKHDTEWGMIKNHFYHKVNEINPNGVTKLSDSTEYLPLYPLVNEVAIDHRDINVFRSSWEDNYYVRSRSGGAIDFIPGTISTVEEKSYFGSTVIKFKPSYSIYQFTTQRVNTEAELDEILRSSNQQTDTVLFEDNNRILVDFYLDNLVAILIGEDGLKNIIDSFVDADKSDGNKDTIEDDVILYALNNMIELYLIDSIELYVKQYKGLTSEINSVNSLDLINNGGWERDQSFTYRLHSKKPLNFRLIYNKKLGYSCSIRALIKIKA
jgi:hypothetical protein